MSEANTKDMTIEAPGKKPGTEPKKGLEQVIKPNSVSNSTGVLTDAQIADQKRDQAIKDFMHPENKLKPVGKKNFFVRNLGLTITAGVLLVGAAGAAIYEGIKKSNEPVPVPEYFDPSALKSVIGANNSIQIPGSEYFASAPTIWNEQNQTMTIPIPILFRDGRTPTLDLEKIPSAYDQRLDEMTIDGTEQGDTILSPIDGEIEVYKTNEDLSFFYLDSKDSQGNDVKILVQGPPLESLIKLDQSISEKGTLLPIKKGQPIGKILNSVKDLLHRYKIKLSGFAPLIKSFNLATTPEEKAILLK